ncbi:hypothetical protein [Jiella mangrovi]|uniref:DUF2232 domain-containing protein n=1 Tax=Jiella mangrovi TaxID=2821407 RepID=A0ABS4BDV1_9HYPH|nr:hypothetical protein [Jiella mangrovi]MBP0614150.1 hypothetical protein [Jiella mangrovi]
MTFSKLLIAAAAGAASALLFVGLVFQSGSAVTLALAAPIPIFIASLGWGSVAGLIAAIVAAGVVVAISGLFSGGVLLFVSMSLPAAIAGHLAGLAKPAAEPETTLPAPAGAQPGLEWYPPERILFAIALMSAAACIGLGWYLGYDVATLKPEIMDALRQSNSTGQINDVEIDAVASLLLSLVPLVQPAILTLILAVGLYLGAWVTRVSDRLPRPRDDLPTSLHLPPIALAVFAVGLAGSFLSGPAEQVALVLCGAFGMAFTFVGLARLHARTRGRSNRGLLLFVSYAAITILSFPLFVFTCLGVYDTVRRMRAGPPQTP